MWIRWEPTDGGTMPILSSPSNSSAWRPHVSTTLKSPHPACNLMTVRASAASHCSRSFSSTMGTTLVASLVACFIRHWKILVDMTSTSLSTASSHPSVVNTFACVWCYNSIPRRELPFARVPVGALPKLVNACNVVSRGRLACTHYLQEVINIPAGEWICLCNDRPCTFLSVLLRR